MMYPQDSLPLCPDALVMATQPSITHEFYQFTQQQQQQYQEQLAFEAYCQWYHQAAAAAQQDLIRMRHDINVLAWFCRNGTTSLRKRYCLRSSHNRVIGSRGFTV